MAEPQNPFAIPDAQFSAQFPARNPQPPENPYALPDAEFSRRYGAANAGMVDDVAKSAGTGVAQGVIGMFGLPGSLSDLGTALMRGIYAKTLGRFDDPESVAAAEKKRVELLAEMQAKGFAPLQPPVTGADIQRGVEDTTGPFYKPQTKQGQYARTVGEFLPGAAMVPGGIVARLAAGAVAPGLASEGAGQYFTGSKYEPWARLAGGLAGGIGAGAALSPLASTARGMASAAPMPIAADAASLRIPLSYAQRTGQLTAHSAEDAARRGVMGPGAQQIAGQFYDNQAGAFAGAREAVRARVAGGQPPVASPIDAAERIGEGVRKAEGQLGAYVDDQYAVARAMGGEFDVGVFKGIGPRIRADLHNSQDALPIDKVTMPHATAALDQLEETLSKLRPIDVTDPRKTFIPGVTVDEMDQARKQLNVRYGYTEHGSADQAAMRNIIAAYDKHVDNAITRGLFTGDPAALDQLKAARATASEYFKQFGKGNGTWADKFIAKLVDARQDIQPTEIANAIYGMGKLGQTGNAVRVTEKLKVILADQPEQMSALKQGLWLRVAGDETMGAGRRAAEIFDFTTGSGKQLSSRVFSPQEIDQMNAYARVLKSTVPPTGGANWSGTAGQVVPELMRQGDRIVASTIGNAIGGPAGAVAGALASAVPGAIRGRMAAGQAELMFKGMPAPSPGMRLLNGVRGGINANVAPGMLGFPQLPTPSAIPGTVPGDGQRR